MDNQGLDIRDVCEDGENLKRIDELLCFLFAALDAECKNRTGTVREIPVVQVFVLRVKRRMVDGLDQRLGLEVLQHLSGVLHMALNAQREGFQTLQQQECVERGQCRTGVAQQDRTNLGGKCRRAACIYKADAVIARIRVDQRCEAAGCLPVELAALDDDTAERCAVTADELGCGMDNDVCAVIERTQQVRRCKRGIDDNRNALCVCDICDRLNVDQVGIRIAQCLKEHCLGVFVDGIGKVLNVVRIDELRGYAVLRQGMCQIVVCAAVNRLRRDDVVTVLCERLEGVAQSRCTGCNCQCGRTALQRRNALFKDILGRIGQSAVDIARIREAKARLCMVAVVEDIRSGLVNRHCACVGCRIGLLLAYVKL